MERRILINHNGELQMIVGFYKVDSPFSNFYPCEFTYRGNHMENSEQAFMYMKAMIFKDLDTAREILKGGRSPSAYKRLGRRVKGFDENTWDAVKYRVMSSVVYEKFSSSQEMWKILDGTCDAILIECSPFDRVWGIGIGVDHPDVQHPDRWEGQNLLGKVLMQVRKDLREEFKEVIH